MNTKSNGSGGIGWSWAAPLAAAAALAIAIASPHAYGVDLNITNVVGNATEAVAWIDRELIVPKFDHNLGTLTQVRIDVVGNVRTTPKIENLTASPRTFVFGSQATVTLKDPDKVPLVTTQPIVLITRLLGAFDGVTNFSADLPGLPSGISQFPQTSTDQKSVIIDSSNAALLNQFVINSGPSATIHSIAGVLGDPGDPGDPGVLGGVTALASTGGTVSLFASATGDWLVTGGAVENSDFVQDIKTAAGINVFVIYTYTPVGYTLSGRLWNDIDLNGVADPGEPGISGRVVTLLYGSDLFSEPGPVLNANGDPLPGTLPQITDADGRYQFTGFVPLDLTQRSFYSVQVSMPSGFTISTYSIFGLSPDPSIIRSTVDLSVAVDSSLAKTNINFGFGNSLARVGGTVWADTDINGSKNGQETGLPGLVVTLTNSTGTVTASTTTDSQGHYVFFGILGDDTPTTLFTVTVRPPASYLPTFDPDDGLRPPGVVFVSPNQTSFPLPVAAAVMDANFGYFGTGQVGDRVWNDLNADGVQDANEPGIAGVVIRLTGGTANLTTTTDSTGYYAFGSSNVLAAGTYTVTATPPPGFRQTFDRDDGSPISSFSTPNSVPNVVLGVGQILTDVDFGYARPSLSSNASIGDRVWSDTNGNGLQDIGEVGIAGVIVVLSAPVGPAATNIYTATDANGFYSFTDLGAGTYQVTVSNLVTFRATLPNPSTRTVTLSVNQIRDDVDFGFQPLGSIGDLVWIDTNGNGLQDELPLTGIAGTTVTIFAQGFGIQTTNVAANGSYHFENLPPGTYTVSVGGVPANYTRTAGPTGNTITLAAGENNSTVDFGFKPPAQAVKNSTVSGVVWLDKNANGILDNGENGIPTATLILHKGSAVVDTFTLSPVLNGRYTFFNLEQGVYNLTVLDPAGNPLSASGDLIPTYDFDDAKGPFNTPDYAGFSLGENANLVDVNFGYRSSLGSVSGLVWNDADANALVGTSENGLVGWTVKLTTVGGVLIGQTATDSCGNYRFNNRPAGSYLVVVTPLPQYGETFDTDGLATANAALVTLGIGQDLININFGYVFCPPLGSIGNRVWNDCDGNGNQDVRETGLVGVIVSLKQGSTTLATALTGPNGIYGFNSLIAGTYTITVTPPNGYVETFGLDGITVGVNRATVVLSSGVNRTDVDFGYRLPPPTCVVPTGTISCEHWGNTWGHSCSQVPVNTTPHSVCGLSSFEPSQNCGDHYGRRVRGYIVPPTTGDYVFWISAADNCQLYLSSDQNAANKQKICETASGCGFREWNRTSSQKSVTCSLTAGVPYYVELLHKQESGADHCSVSWCKPGENTSCPSEVIPGNCLAPITAPLCTPACAGTGLAGTYYRNRTLTPPAMFTRVDPTIDFSWGPAGPSPNFVHGNYSVSWTGQVEAPVSGLYTFTNTSDDGVRLWVNGQLLVDNWTEDHAWTDHSGTITLTAGQKYSIRMDHFEHGGRTIIRLLWSYPGQAAQVVPTCRLYPTAGQPNPPCVVKCEAETGSHSSNGGYHNNGCGYSSTHASGGSAVGWLDNVGAYCQVSCVAPSTGSYQLKLRCSNGYRTPCVRSVYVNGVKCGTITHNGTGGWESYSDSTPITVNLNSGNNTIKVCRDNTSQGGAIDIDYFECSK